MATETIRTDSRDGPAGRRGARAAVGVVLLVVGVVVLAATSGYYLYGRFARSNLDDLSFEAERPQFAGEGYGLTTPASGASILTPPSTSAVDAPQSTGAPQGVATVVSASAGAAAGNPAANAPSASGTQAAATERPTAGPSSGSAAVAASGPSQIGAGTGSENFGDTEVPDGTSRPGGTTAVVPTAVPRVPASSGTPATSAAVSRTPSVSATADPLQFTSPDTGPASVGVSRPAEPDPRLAAIEASIAEVSTYSAPTPEDLAYGGALATRIRIPAIEVDAVVDELRIMKLGDSLAWETPKRVVGHIPRTAKAGAAGQGWYFGHLESPLRGEGNVFARLPEIPMLAVDSPIYIFLETADRHYAYQVYVTEVVYEDDIALTDTGSHDITLVTCTPRFYYDHRLLVTAALVGIRDA